MSIQLLINYFLPFISYLGISNTWLVGEGWVFNKPTGQCVFIENFRMFCSCFYFCYRLWGWHFCGEDATWGAWLEFCLFGLFTFFCCCIYFIFLLSSLKLFFCGCFRCRWYILVALVRIPCGRLIVGNSFAVVDAFILWWFRADIIAWLRMSLLGYVLWHNLSLPWVITVCSWCNIALGSAISNPVTFFSWRAPHG